MKPSPGVHKNATLSQAVLHQLNLYALGATAAGVSLLSLTQAAEAKIIYTATNFHFHPDSKHKKIVYNLDLNHDGIVDFMLVDQIGTAASGSRFKYFTVSGIPSRNGIEIADYPAFAERLFAGSVIPGRKFKASGLMAGQPCQSCRGSGLWGDGRVAYLGLAFKIHGKNHFGWARLKVQLGDTITATLTGYAYETVPGRPIKAAHTKGPDVPGVDTPTALLTGPHSPVASLGVLALGAPALSIWRRERA